MTEKKDIFRNKLSKYITNVRKLAGEADTRKILPTSLTDEFWKFDGPLLQILVNTHTLLTADPISVMGLLRNNDFSAKEIQDLQKEGRDLINNMSKDSD